MAGFGEDQFFGLFALALVPVIAFRLWRGFRSGRVPLYRRYVTRDDIGTGKFRLLLALHGVSLILMAGIAADLLFNLGLRE